MDAGEGVASNQSLACPEEVEVDRLLDDLREPGVDSGGGDRPAAGALGHQEDVAGGDLLAGGEVAGDTDGADAAGHPGTKDHVPADTQG